jgi:hypothetical protein
MKKTDESCVWKSESQCEDCINSTKLNCRWKLGDLLLFCFAVFPPMICVLAGAVLIGAACSVWWPTVSYILFFPVILGIAETKFLCSHCPYHNQKGHILHCLANHGFIKIWRYNPKPMNKTEKNSMISLALLFLAVIPIVIFGYDIRYFYANISSFGRVLFISVIFLSIITLFSIISFAFIMIKHFCSKCVNFSCPFNLVEKRNIDVFLAKNETMRNAWSESGYSSDEAGQAKNR